MREVLASDSGYRYISQRSLELLAHARLAFKTERLSEGNLLTRGGSLEWFPWTGTKVLRTFELFAKADGLRVDVEKFSIRYVGTSREELRSHAQRIASGRISESELARHVSKPIRDRFDEYVPHDLLVEAYLREMTDIPNAGKAAQTLL